MNSRASNIIAADILYRYPLFMYCNNEGAMEVVIIGKGCIRDAVLQLVFGCAQLPNKELKIHVISDDAKSYVDTYHTHTPTLFKVAVVHLDGELISDNLDINLTDSPMANIYFNSGNTGTAVERLLSDPDFDPRYFLVVNDKKSENEELVPNLVSFLRGTEKCCCVNAFVDMDLESIDDVTISRINDFQGSRILSGEAIAVEQLAYNIHRVYCKNNDERSREKDIIWSFENKEGDYFAYRSSLRSALSIAYKLYISECYDSDDPAKAYFERVINHDEQIAQITFVEHCSWLAYMLITGWKSPKDADLRKLAYTNGNTNKSFAERLHICLCKSTPESTLAKLKTTSTAWKKELDKLQEYDPLDCMSLRFHALCEELTIARKAEILQKLDSLKISICTIQDSNTNKSTIKNNYVAIDVIVHKMLDGENNTNKLWEQICHQFVEQNLSLFPKVKSCFEALASSMLVVVERNSFHDYKASDKAIVLAIPQLLSSFKPKIIYKLTSSRIWENAISSMVLEPQKLVLLTNKKISSRKSTLKNFLIKERHLEIEIATETIERLASITITSDAVLDITGASPEDVCLILSNEQFRNLPIISLSHGRYTLVQNTKHNAFDINYYTCEGAPYQKLTTGEALMLMNSALSSEQSETNQALGLSDCYQKLWAAYTSAMRKCEKNSAAAWKKLNDAIGKTYDYRAPTLELELVITEFLREVRIILSTLQSLNIILSYSEDGNKFVVSFPNTAMIDTLSKTGNVLEVYVFQSLFQSGLFDDVRISAKIDWNKSLPAGDLRRFANVEQTSNEIDIVCTKGMRTCFISCKLYDFTKDNSKNYHLYEIRYLSDKLGMNTAAFLVSGKFNGMPVVELRAKQMGVTLIGEQLLGDPEKLATAVYDQIK